MPAELALVAAPSPAWRVERVNPVLSFSHINALDALSGRAGNRFDVPGAGVLYGASRAEGAYAETLAGFRPQASMIGQFSKIEADPGRVGPGQVPAGWLSTRRLRALTVTGSLPFVDVEDPASHTYLTHNAAPVLVRQGLENLDVATIRGSNRLVTRAIASWLYSRTDQHGRPLYAGIRYMSRLGDFECWAVFEGTPVELRSSAEIQTVDPSLQTVLDLFDISIH